jgi:phytoene synthase
MIDGVSLDLVPHAVATADDLYRYCYLVASVVGLTIIHIFGFSDPRALELAEMCGQAFQLTNIIRDVKEDAAMGRVYLPAVSPEAAVTPAVLPHLRQLGARAFEMYDRSRPLVNMVDADSRASLWALIEIYHRLLKKIEAAGYQVLDGRIRLSRWEKLSVVAQAALRRR